METPEKYFKQVTDFGKNIFTSDISNKSTNYNIFDFFMNNLIALILIILIVGIILWSFTFIKVEQKKRKAKLIDNSFYHSRLDDKDTFIVRCDQMDIPKEINKYTYSFNLNINEFYLNKGTWKCLMLKGIDMTNYEPKKCTNFGTENGQLNINKKITPEDCFKYVCDKEYKELNMTRHNPNEIASRVDADNLNERVDLICRATKMGKEAKKLLACGMSKCNLVGKDMLLGHANSFIDAHNDYCTKVYTGYKVDKDTKVRYTDQIDNVCSNKTLMEKYPHLIPRDLTGFINSKKLDKRNIDKFDDNSVDNTIETCWDDLVNELPIQAPGVWLHPFINNIRIVFTTFTSKKYDKDNFNFSHSHDKTIHKSGYYNINYIKKDETGIEHPNVVKYDENKCGTVSEKEINQSEYVYREFFDIENIPIREIFHIAIVVNQHSVEVYINAKLVKTQVLFGEPRYNKGDLYLNYAGNLNGSITDFKFISYAINQNNIQNIINHKPIIQENNGSNVILDKEHSHNFEFSHDHKFNLTNESEHNHSLEDQDVTKEYYLD